ncbi:MAG TPA: hypothetical protein VNR67_08285 [Solirubrobacterales bacterium]|nr:hypothetical protein [Solirubrobacterales bacterium]
MAAHRARLALVRLKPGKHVFKVRAIDEAGNVGRPAMRRFTVLE